MNIQTTVKPDRYATQLAKAVALHEAAGNLVAALTKSGGRYSTRALRADLALSEAVCRHYDDFDGDAFAAGVSFRDEMGADEPEEPEFDQAFVHPDDPCQLKGFR